MKKQNIILSLLLFIVIILFAINPQENMSACLSGIKTWALYVLPALFPFFVLTRLLSSLGIVEKIGNKLSGVTRFLFGTPGVSAYVYLMSILSGYPVGAKLTADLYEQGAISQQEAIKITTFTSTSGPLFIIGTVSAGMFANVKLGIVILISHLLGAIANGILFRRYGGISVSSMAVQAPKNILEESMWSSIKSILVIGGYVSVFFVLIQMLNTYKILTPINIVLGGILSLVGISSQTATGITDGFFEVTRGCLTLSQLSIPLPVVAIILTFIISFGGLCIHMQAMTFLKKFNMKMSFYFLMKITQAILSALICIPFALIML